MSEGLNRWMGLGNLSRDPELRMTPSGQAVLKLGLACSERFKDRSGEWKERTEFINCVVWGKRAEALAKILRKGSSVFIEGGLRTTSYEKDGEKRYRTEVNATNVILGGGGARGGSSERQERAPATATGGGGYDDADYGEPAGGDDLPF